MAHIVSNTQPPYGALGDEWFNPSTNKLFKLVALGGTNVSWQDGGNIISGTSGGTASATSASVLAALSAGQAIILASNGQISANVTSLATSLNIISTTNENTFTARQNYTGNTTATAVKFWNATEQMTVSGTTPGSTGNTTLQIDLANSAVYYFTQSATNNWTVNFRMSSTTFLNSGMGNNESLSAVVLATQGTAPYYANLTQIDGVVVTPRWQDGIAPVAGNASAIDVYNYTIIKTANATYTVLGSQSKFA